MARASETSMEELHGALCGYFLNLINGRIPELVKVIEKDADTGESIAVWKNTGLMVRPGAGDLAVMAKFLKDNAITGALVDGSGLSELSTKLAERHARRGKLPTAADVKDAMRELGGDLLQ